MLIWQVWPISDNMDLGDMDATCPPLSYQIMFLIFSTIFSSTCSIFCGIMDGVWSSPSVCLFVCIIWSRLFVLRVYVCLELRIKNFHTKKFAISGIKLVGNRWKREFVTWQKCGRHMASMSQNHLWNQFRSCDCDPNSLEFRIESWKSTNYQQIIMLDLRISP